MTAGPIVEKAIPNVARIGAREARADSRAFAATAETEDPAATHTRGWQPLLNGVLKQQAEETVEAIATAVSGLYGTMPANLAGGAAGLAVMHGYLAATGFQHDAEDAAESWLQRAIEAMSAVSVDASLYSGLAGVGWAVEHLHNQLRRLDGEEINAEITDTLLELLSHSPWAGDYDLIGGLVGIGVYALERRPHASADALLERVIDHLAETAERRADGLTWWTNPAWLIPETREKCPHGYYNLGLAHGVPGVIALLGRACAADVAIGKARPLLDGAVRWLLVQQPADGTGYTHWIEPEKEEPPKPARLAWCYGDLCISAALLLAAGCVGEPEWERAALNIALRAVARPVDQAGVVDAGLCHGAAGLGHLFNRLFQATGDVRFADAARFWFRRTLELRHPERGIAGYAAWMPLNPGEEGWVGDPGLLTGAAGIALALLAATTTIEPDWDRLLLVSIRPRQ